MLSPQQVALSPETFGSHTPSNIMLMRSTPMEVFTSTRYLGELRCETYSSTQWKGTPHHMIRERPSFESIVDLGLLLRSTFASLCVFYSK